MRIQRPVLADALAESERFTICGQQKFDRGGVESDSVIQRANLVEFIDAADNHHAHENLNGIDLAWVACEERFDGEWFVRFDDNVYP